jgi:hypothetical protein
MSEKTDAVTMARDAGENAKAFRAALRAQRLHWHIPGSRWLVTIGSAEHLDMERVLKEMKGGRGV